MQRFLRVAPATYTTEEVKTKMARLLEHCEERGEEYRELADELGRRMAEGVSGGGIPAPWRRAAG
jgi:hypothetical protein